MEYLNRIESAFNDLKACKLVVKKSVDAESIEEFRTIVNSVQPRTAAEKELFACVNHIVHTTKCVTICRNTSPAIVLLLKGRDITKVLNIAHLIHMERDGHGGPFIVAVQKSPGRPGSTGRRRKHNARNRSGRGKPDKSDGGRPQNRAIDTENNCTNESRVGPTNADHANNTGVNRRRANREGESYDDSAARASDTRAGRIRFGEDKSREDIERFETRIDRIARRFQTEEPRGDDVKVAGKKTYADVVKSMDDEIDIETDAEIKAKFAAGDAGEALPAERRSWASMASPMNSPRKST